MKVSVKFASGNFFIQRKKKEERKEGSSNYRDFE